MNYYVLPNEIIDIQMCSPNNTINRTRTHFASQLDTTKARQLHFSQYKFKTKHQRFSADGELRENWVLPLEEFELLFFVGGLCSLRAGDLLSELQETFETFEIWSCGCSLCMLRRTVYSGVLILTIALTSVVLFKMKSNFEAYVSVLHLSTKGQV